MNRFLFLSLFLLISSMSCTDREPHNSNVDSSTINKEVSTTIDSSKSVLSFASFIPPNWVIVDTSVGDLNKDMQDDVALVIQDTDKSKIIRSDSIEGGETSNQNPRTLLVLFKDSLTNTYKQVVKNETFIPLDDVPPLMGPYSGIKIKNGSLTINFYSFSSMGSYGASSSSYQFRYQDNDFALIGVENTEFSRSTGESTNYSINFLSKNYCINKGNEFDETVKPTTECKKFQLDRLKTLSTFPKAFGWEFKGLQL